MGVYVPSGDKTAVRRTAEFFLKVGEGSEGELGCSKHRGQRGRGRGLETKPKRNQTKPW